MKVDELSNHKLKVFCQNCSLEVAWYGGRKFAAEVAIDDVEYKITASAKEIYAALKRKESEISKFEQVEGRFHELEMKTRDRGVYSQQLNLAQRVCYFFIKMFCGLSVYDASNGAQPFASMLQTLHDYLVDLLTSQELKEQIEELERRVKNISQYCAYRDAQRGIYPENV